MLLRAIIIVLLVVPSFSYAAISCGDVTAFNDGTPTDPETIAYITPAGSNQVLFMGVTIRHSTASIDLPTHAGNNMTSVTTSAFNDPIRSQLWYIPNPAAGTNNVIAHFGIAPLADAIVIWTCSGVDTANPIRSFVTATGFGTAVTATVPTVLSGDVVVDIFGSDLATTNPTIGANQTSLNHGNDGAELGWGASQQAGADGGVMSWTAGVSQEWAIMAASLRPAGTRSHIAPLVTR